MVKLTLKQETFCKEYIANGGNATQAYKKSYNTKATDVTINANSCRMMKNPKIKERLEQLKEPLQKKFEYTVEQSFNKFLEIQNIALNNMDLSNAIKCEENKCKLLGLFAPEKQDINIQKSFKDFLKAIK